jgi:hypothetical protein
VDPVPFLWAAGAIQLLVAASNVPAARMFGYRKALRAMPTFVAEVFVVQNVFIMLTTFGMAGLCLLFARELAAGGSLVRALCGFLAAFWGIRLGFQLFFYDRELRRKYRLFDVLFVFAFAYLALVFTAAALGLNAHR